MPATTVRDLERLRTALRSAWDARTSSDEGWTPGVPERGQCAVTALIVQDSFGGELIRADVSGVSHYWNRLADGTEIDLTRGQFERFEPEGLAIRSRDYVLSYPLTRARYELLRQRLAS